MPADVKLLLARRCQGLSACCRCAIEPQVLRTNLMIAAIVGTLLSVANEFDVIGRIPLNATVLAKIGFNFLVPFAVSTVSAALNRRNAEVGNKL